MSDRTDKLIIQMAERTEALVKDVNEIKHSLAALIEAIGIADTAPKLAALSLAKEQAAKAAAALDEERSTFITWCLTAFEGPHGPERVAYLRGELAGSKHAPLTDHDIVEWNLNGTESP